MIYPKLDQTIGIQYYFLLCLGFYDQITASPDLVLECRPPIDGLQERPVNVWEANGQAARC